MFAEFNCLQSHSRGREYGRQNILWYDKKLFYAKVQWHMGTFRNRKYEHETALSTYIWSLKDGNRQFNLKWSIETRAKAYEPGGKRCNLCIMEKIKILGGGRNMLNSRSELMAKCVHRRKHILKSLSKSDRNESNFTVLAQEIDNNDNNNENISDLAHDSNNNSDGNENETTGIPEELYRVNGGNEIIHTVDISLPTQTSLRSGRHIISNNRYLGDEWVT